MRMLDGMLEADTTSEGGVSYLTDPQLLADQMMLLADAAGGDEGCLERAALLCATWAGEGDSAAGAALALLAKTLTFIREGEAQWGAGRGLKRRHGWTWLRSIGP